MAITPAQLRAFQRNASAPEKARARRKPPVQRERHVQRAIEDYLTVEIGPRGVGWFRMPSGKVEVAGGKGHLELNPEGTADLLVIIPWNRAISRSARDRTWAVPLWIEVKTPGARTQKRRALKQKAFREEMNSRGCIAIEADSLKQVKAALPPRGLKIPT